MSASNGNSLTPTEVDCGGGSWKTRMSSGPCHAIKLSENSLGQIGYLCPDAPLFITTKTLSI